MRSIVRLLIPPTASGLIIGCAATLQTPDPMLVGDSHGIPLYSISGYTKWGEMSQEDARGYAGKYMRAMCPNGAPRLIAAQTWDASRMGHHQLGWTATFSCEKLGR